MLRAAVITLVLGLTASARASPGPEPVRGSPSGSDATPGEVHGPGDAHGSAVELPERRARLATSPALPGLGPRLGARLRRDGVTPQPVLIRGLAPAEVERAGGRVTAVIGPVVAATLSPAAIRALAPRAAELEAPAPLRPMLDVSRQAIGADVLDRGHDLPRRFRGAGALVAVYDTGVDLRHPDLRLLDGKSRVVAVWDQILSGRPPAGQALGLECAEAALASDTCPTADPIGHGTHVLAIAGSSGPRYRGVAPEADLALARSADFQHLTETLAWFDAVARRRAEPLVVNLSLGGQTGPHDGTSLECQVLDAYPHLVVAAAGNEGTTPVHARVALAGGAARDVVLRFPSSSASPIDRTAFVDVWLDPGSTIAVSVELRKPRGAALAATSTIAPGDPGRTERLSAGSARGLFELDAETSAANGKGHVSVALELFSWLDDPSGRGLAVVHLEGSGGADLWVDTPADQPDLATFDTEGALGASSEVLADAARSVSDLATAASALAVSAYTTRTSYPLPGGSLRGVAGRVGALAAFTAFGPSLAPERTGHKPDLAAPGLVVVAARSTDAPLTDPRLVSPLYAAKAGTSMATPHVAGVAALVLGARPTMSKGELKDLLLTTARAGEIDPSDARWGAGRVDAEAAVRTAAGLAPSPGCTTLGAARPGEAARASPVGWVLVLFALGLRGLRGPRPRAT